ncbi:DUF427 domain-containing protein [Pelagibius sp.]|uniref:DUF427 domain-containing protein n=1 Tax=Pelagibius sp. TaxID=1931238 RepID=UPI00263641A7|nr:DUF427 domain-containing protein [Pelagibius sp.]
MSEPAHRATVTAAQEHYVARVGDTVVARSSRALILEEVSPRKTYAPVIYFPLEDVDQTVLRPCDHHSFCPIKGEAAYHDIAVDGQLLERAAWFYPDPLLMVAGVKNHLAFYRDKVAVEGA